MNFMELYHKQDQTLSYLASFLRKSNNIHFTGGTALSRFFFKHRYSEDLDFIFFGEKKPLQLFMRFSDSLSQIGRVQIIYNDLEGTHSEWLIYLDNNECPLKIELTEKNYRKNSPVIIDEIPVEKLNYLLCGKLEAFLGRDDDKDIIDLMTAVILSPQTFKSALNIAQRISSNFKLVEFLKKIHDISEQKIYTVLKTMTPFLIRQYSIQELSEARKTILHIGLQIEPPVIKETRNTFEP